MILQETQSRRQGRKCCEAIHPRSSCRQDHLQSLRKSLLNNSLPSRLRPYILTAKSHLSFVKVPSFSGDSDHNVYLDWEAKCEQIFYVHGVNDDQKVKIASLEFLDYAMKLWHRLVMDIGLNKRPPVVSWEDLKECMRIRFVPPHFRKDLLLKLQRLQQGTLSVDAYFKELETLLIKVEMHDSEEAKIARFVSGLRRDIQDVVELHESKLPKKHAFKNSPNDNYYNNSWKK